MKKSSLTSGFFMDILVVIQMDFEKGWNQE